MDGWEQGCLLEWNSSQISPKTPWLCVLFNTVFAGSKTGANSLKHVSTDKLVLVFTGFPIPSNDIFDETW